MPEYLAPGVYVEEIPTGARPIEGVSTGVAGFVGPTFAGPVDVVIGPLTCLAEFEGKFGRATALSFSDKPPLPYVMWHAVRAFFSEGGKRLFVARAQRGCAKRDGYPCSDDYARALAGMQGVEDVAVIAAPGHTYAETSTPDDMATTATALVASAERRRDRIAILDTPNGQTTDQVRA